MSRRIGGILLAVALASSLLVACDKKSEPAASGVSTATPTSTTSAATAAPKSTATGSATAQAANPALEAMLKVGGTGRFSHGDTPTIADICLVPQVFNAQRFNTEAELRPAYPTLFRVFDECMKNPAFDAARPEKQPDNE